MTCDRCQGCMMREHVYRHGPWWWRCFQCGERLDGIILRARAEQAAAAAMLREAEQRDLKEWAGWMARIPGHHIVEVNK